MMKQLSTATFDAAMTYASLGWPTHLLYGVQIGDDQPGACQCLKADCARPGKHPRRKAWQRNATSNPNVLRGWLEMYPGSNLAVATRGLVVLDFDPRAGSDESESRLIENFGPWPAAPEVLTGGGGRHIYFSADGWYVANRLPALKDVRGIDVRGVGGYVVAPPSVHASGEQYRSLVEPSGVLPPLPSYLTEGLVADLAASPRPKGCTDYGWKALAGEYHSVATAPSGQRNEQLFKASCRIWELVAGGQVDDESASTYLSAAAHIAGLPDHEVSSTISSGRARGLLKPRQVPPPFGNRQDALSQLADIRCVAHNQAWKGHPGKRQIAVLDALIRCAMRAGGPKFPRGVRGIAQEAGITSIKSVTTALRELQEAGWVTKLYVGTSTNRPSKWKIHLPPPLSHSDHEDTHLCIGGIGGTSHHPTVAVGHDAFRMVLLTDPETGVRRGHGLGKNAWRVVELLHRGPQPSRAAIGRALAGMHPSTASRIVEKLKEQGLVEIGGNGIVLSPNFPQRLTEASMRMGTDGRAEAQRRYAGWKTGQSYPDGLPELVACPHRPQCTIVEGHDH